MRPRRVWTDQECGEEVAAARDSEAAREVDGERKGRGRGMTGGGRGQ